MASFKAMDTAE